MKLTKDFTFTFFIENACWKFKCQKIDLNREKKMEERKCVYINWLVLLLSCGEKRWRRTCIDYLHFYGTFSETESVASKPMRRSFYFCG